MSYRSAVVLAVLLSTACVPSPLEQPEPVSFKTSRSKAEVVQVASRELTAAGFEIAASDSVAGTLSARRTREKRGNFDYITCKFAENSLAETNLESVLTVTVSASGTGAASDVRIGTSVLAKYPNLEGTPLPRSDSQTDCASTGAIERQLVAALGR